VRIRGSIQDGCPGDCPGKLSGVHDTGDTQRTSEDAPSLSEREASRIGM
jgi:hypothetical protein